jgi:poly(3-hydroxybutyrate) depolymerase
MVRLSTSCVAVLAISLAAVTPSRAQSPQLPVGPASVEIANAAPDGGPVRVFTYRPAGLTPDDAIVFVMHGVRRNADDYRNTWIAPAETRRFLVVAPEMSQAAFPGDAGYNFGNMVDESGVARPPERWAWRTIERIFDATRAATGSTRITYSIFGHSAGAQFVHRFVMYAEVARLDAAIAANAGWYTVPMFDVAFPYGLKGSPSDATRMKANFAKPLVILLGDRDIDPNHKALRRDAGADAQGTYRLARGQYFMRASAVEAQRLGASFAWRMETVPGVAHNETGMTAAAVRWLFDNR